MTAWLWAFLVTQFVEVPIYAIALKSRPIRIRMAAAFAPSCVTHPLVWLGVLAAPVEWYWPAVVVAEVLAIVVEALIVQAAGASRAFLWAAAANGASVAVGLTLRALFGFP